MKDFTHYTVMKNEAVDALNCKDGLVYVDCTLGGGGHSELILQRISPNGKLISFDIDQDAIDAASERLKAYKNLTIVKDSYTNVKQVLKNLGIEKITGGILFDLGASYHQLTKQERGFSFSKEAPLDMRFNMDSNFSAYDVVNDYSEDEFVKLAGKDAWWRSSTGSVLGVPTSRAIVNGKRLICWDDDYYLPIFTVF